MHLNIKEILIMLGVINIICLCLAYTLIYKKINTFSTFLMIKMSK